VPIRFSVPAGSPYFPATLSINPSPPPSPTPSPTPLDPRYIVATTYADNDNVIRPADAIYPDPTANTAGTGSWTPYYYDPANPTTSIVYRPIMLNRPFRNGAELGYVFRDLPWKTLDFFTDKSADAGLLDVFCVNDGSRSTTPYNANGDLGTVVPIMAAGSINLNSTQAAELQTVFAGAILDELNSATQVSSTGTGVTAAPVLAANVVSATSTTPMQNRSELITRPGLPLAILPTPTPAVTPQPNQVVKARREVVARTLPSTSQTRVWNLLIDVIAQSGHYKPNAQNLGSDFIVEGEQHYWVHVAIDRFTGQVIDKQIEVVNE
jgi:hypothetical protein